MGAYEQVLDLAREQSAAIARGDIEAAVRLLPKRAALLASAPPAGAADADTIREIIRRDRDLSGAIRERMIDLRNRAVRSQHGRVALAGYHTRALDKQQLLDATR
jgi:hypothetical protein